MALIDPAFDAFFARTVRALSPYLDQFVIIGGCANALYRHIPGANPGLIPLGTYDVDVVSPNVLHKREIGLIESLAAENLYPQPETQQTNKYKQSPSANEKIELLCPAQGLSKVVRRKAPSLVEVQDGAIAEALEYLDLLQECSVKVDLRTVPGLGFADPAGFVVRVPHPILYVIQKALIRSKRKSNQEKGKDSYYTYEVAFMFRGDLPEFCCQLRDTKSLWQGKRLPKAIEVLKEQFAHERSEGVLQVVDVGTDSSQEILPAAVLRATGRLVTALEGLQKGKS